MATIDEKIKALKYALFQLKTPPSCKCSLCEEKRGCSRVLNQMLDELQDEALKQ